ncbi:MAG: DUF4391 domain-containing protein [Flexilinea sp.]
MNFPKITEFNKRIPKQKFYENLSITPELKRIFVEQIKEIVWRNKLAPATLNIVPGEMITELEVFLIRLNQKDLDRRILKLIDREIPYHILFLLEYESSVQAWIGYKEAGRQGSFKVDSYYHTEWEISDQLDLKLNGLSLDAIYENLIRQIGKFDMDEPIAAETTGINEEPGIYIHNNGIRDQIKLHQRRDKISKQIDALETKVRNEKQFNRKVELNNELKILKKELEILK